MEFERWQLPPRVPLRHGYTPGTLVSIHNSTRFFANREGLTGSDCAFGLATHGHAEIHADQTFVTAVHRAFIGKKFIARIKPFREVNLSPWRIVDDDRVADRLSCCERRVHQIRSSRKKI